jgi:hypothetical protein
MASYPGVTGPGAAVGDAVLMVVTRRVLTDKPVHRLPDEVSVPHMARVLLDHVDEQPPQAGGAAVARGGGVVQSAVGKRLGHQFAGAAHRVLDRNSFTMDRKRPGCT